MRGAHNVSPPSVGPVGLGAVYILRMRDQKYEVIFCDEMREKN